MAFAIGVRAVAERRVLERRLRHEEAGRESRRLARRADLCGERVHGRGTCGGGLRPVSARAFERAEHVEAARRVQGRESAEQTPALELRKTLKPALDAPPSDGSWVTSYRTSPLCREVFASP